MVIQIYKTIDEIQNAYFAMNHLVFSLSAAILLTTKEKQLKIQSQSSMKALITKEKKCGR